MHHFCLWSITKKLVNFIHLTHAYGVLIAQQAPEMSGTKPRSLSLWSLHSSRGRQTADNNKLVNYRLCEEVIKAVGRIRRVWSTGNTGGSKIIVSNKVVKPCCDNDFEQNLDGGDRVTRTDIWVMGILGRGHSNCAGHKCILRTQGTERKHV